jgi:hypothetical protein
MVGVAGVERWRQHALGSARVLSEAPPDFVRLRTFIPAVGTAWHQRWQEGRLTLLSPFQALAETRLLIENLIGPTLLLSDHVSNFLNLQGQLPDHRDKLLSQIDEALDWPRSAFRVPSEMMIGMGL